MRRSKQNSSRLDKRDKWRELMIEGKVRYDCRPAFVTETWQVVKHCLWCCCCCYCAYDYNSVLRRAVRVAVTPMMMLHERSTELSARARGGERQRESSPQP